MSYLRLKYLAKTSTKTKLFKKLITINLAEIFFNNIS